MGWLDGWMRRESVERANGGDDVSKLARHRAFHPAFVVDDISVMDIHAWAES